MKLLFYAFFSLHVFLFNLTIIAKFVRKLLTFCNHEKTTTIVFVAFKVNRRALDYQFHTEHM